MLVTIVFFDDGYGKAIAEVFGSVEKAEEYVEEHNSGPNDWHYFAESFALK